MYPKRIVLCYEDVFQRKIKVLREIWLVATCYQSILFSLPEDYYLTQKESRYFSFKVTWFIKYLGIFPTKYKHKDQETYYFSLP